MLKRKHRLAKTKEVRKVFLKGRSFFNPFITIKVLQNIRGFSRFTVIVSTKVAKKAVKRNRLKRILREFIRLRLNKFILGDYSIIIKPKSANIGESDLISSFENLLIKSRLLL